MSTVHQRERQSSALGLEKVLVLGLVAFLVVVAAVFVVSQVGGSATNIRACLTSPTQCADTGTTGLGGR